MAVSMVSLYSLIHFPHTKPILPAGRLSYTARNQCFFICWFAYGISLLLLLAKLTVVHVWWL